MHALHDLHGHYRRSENRKSPRFCSRHQSHPARPPPWTRLPLDPVWSIPPLRLARLPRLQRKKGTLTGKGKSEKRFPGAHTLGILIGQRNAGQLFRNGAFDIHLLRCDMGHGFSEITGQCYNLRSKLPTETKKKIDTKFHCVQTAAQRVQLKNERFLIVLLD